MFPLRDSQPTYKFPAVTVAIIVINVIVFLLELMAPDIEVFIETYSLVPALVNIIDVSSFSGFITSQFLHAGFIHIISNMWFLRIFGDNVEEEMGSFKFLLFYLLAGLIGNFAQYSFSLNISIPILGASGAVAGVLGAYLVYFPRHTVKTLVPFFGFMTVVNIPVSIMLFYWFLTQLFSGLGSIALAQIGGVAWWAHIGGFAVAWIIAKTHRISKKASEVEEGEVLD